MSFRIIDISKDLFTTDIYPGDPLPEISVFSAINAGDGCNMASVKTTLHCGTHADAPLHFINSGEHIAQVPLENFIGECQVIEVDTDCITGQYVDEHFPKSAERLLLKSGGKVYFDKTGAEEVAYYGIKLIGVDSLSVGCHADQQGPHRALLSEGVSILENLDLADVEPGRYFLVAQPIKIGGADASPVRALLLDGYIFWSD